MMRHGGHIVHALLPGAIGVVVQRAAQAELRHEGCGDD